MKILAIGMNYVQHVHELDNELPIEPVVFMKPDSALLKDNKPFFLPDFSDEIHYETELIVRINRLGKNIAERFAHRYYSHVGLGIDFTARDIQRHNRPLGYPWETSKAFDGSAVVSEFLPVEEFGHFDKLDFHLDIDGNTVQRGNSADMIFNIDKIIAFVSRFFTLKIGDIIFTGTPVGIGQVHPNNHLEGYINDKKMLDFYVK